MDVGADRADWKSPSTKPAGVSITPEMDPIKQKLWADLREVLHDLWLACRPQANSSGPLYASAPEKSGDDASLCYFHLN